MIYDSQEDSFLLEKEVRKRVAGKKVLDMGCGSGIQMNAALNYGAREVLGVDIDKESVEFCRKKRFDVVQSDLFEKIEGKFDLIIFNPPYLPSDYREDKESATATSGGKRGDEVIVRFLKEVGNYLEKDGMILMITSSLTPEDRIDKILKEKKMKKKLAASENLFMEEIYVWEIERS